MLGGDAQVLPQGAGKKIRLLQHDPDPAAQVVQADLRDIRSADGDAPVLRGQGVEPVQQVHEGGLARARTAEDAEGRAGGNGKGHVVQHLPAALIGKGHVVKADVPGQGRGQGAFRVLLLLRVHDVADTVDADAGFGHLADHPAELAHGPDEHAVIAEEGDILAAGHAAAQAEDHAEHDHEHDLDPGENIRRGPEKAHELSHADPEPGIGFIVFFKTVALVPLPAEGPDDAHAGQVLLRHGGKPALALVTLLESPAELPVEEEGIPDDDRQRNHGHQRHGDVHAHHEADAHHQEDRDPDQVRHLLRDKAPGGLDIAGTALDDVSRVMAHMPLEGEALDMAEKGIPHGLDQGLAGPGVRHPEPVACHGADQSHENHAEAGKPELLPDDLRPAGRAEQGLHRAGQVFHRRAADNVINGHADDLGDHHLRQRGQRRAAHAKNE